jgi:hypothetical protein
MALIPLVEASGGIMQQPTRMSRADDSSKAVTTSPGHGELRVARHGQAKTHNLQAKSQPRYTFRALIFLTNIDHQWAWLNLTGVRNQIAFSQTLRLQDAVCTALSSVILEAPSGPDASMPKMAPMAAPAISANLSSRISMLGMAFHSHS